MISKEQFCKWMEDFRTLERDTRRVHEALNTLDPDFGGLFLSRHETMILRLIEELMDDTSKDSMISWFVYDTEWGKSHNWCKCSCKKEFTVETPEILYDVLTCKHA